MNADKRLYDVFLNEAIKLVGRERVYTDELRRLAWGTDAGFYRMIPQIVIRSESEGEVSALLATASKFDLPVTFRAAGTHWENYKVSDDASSITLQPGIIGEHVNEILRPHGRIFTPDPASKKSAMVGGIVINNASGMNCGTHANSDKQLLSMRIVMSDGLVLDTADPRSRAMDEDERAMLMQQLEDQMLDAANSLDFEKAAKLRDQLFELKGKAPVDKPQPTRRKRRVKR